MTEEGRSPNGHYVRAGDTLWTQEELASIFRCSQAEISRFTTMGVLKRVEGDVGGRGRAGKYQLADSVARWHEHKLRVAKGGKTNDVARELALAKLAKAKEDAIQAQLKTQERRGKLVQTDALLAFLRDVVVRFRDSLIQVPDHWDVSRTQKAIFKEDLVKTLNELSRIGPDVIQQVSETDYSIEDDVTEDIDEQDNEKSIAAKTFDTENE
jgi:phage terminase Nu1 subunit (DNA packaging protein)